MYTVQYTLPVTGNVFLNPAILVTSLSKDLTFSWADSFGNSCKKLAWVPVAPLIPRNFNSSLICLQSFSSSRRSRIQSVARFPTVVNWALWKWVYPTVGKSLYSLAKLASRSIHLAILGKRISNPSRMMIRSALSVTKQDVAPRWMIALKYGKYTLFFS